MSAGDQTWTSGLLPMIDPDEVIQIISRMSDLAVIVSDDGVVLGAMVNPSFRGHPDLSRWQGLPLADQLTVESIPKFEKRMDEFATRPEGVLPLEMNHKQQDDFPEFPVRYSFHRIGNDGAVLMLGSDLRSTAEMQQQLVAAQIALEKDYEAQRDNDLKFRVLMTATDDAIVYVAAHSGAIVEANSAAAAILGRTITEMHGLPIDQMIEAKSKGALVETLLGAASDPSASPIKATAAKSRKAINLRTTLFRTSGEQLLLCKIMAADGARSRSDELNDNLAELFENGIDAIVFANKDGTILSSNEAFSKLADIPHSQGVTGRSLADFLNRGSVDLNVIFDNATRSGAMRLYATRIKSELGADRSIEISTSRLRAGDDAIFALIIRDASRLETVRITSSQITDVDMRSVIEFIGSQSLKDIVAKTTDVVEKMCIETAVEMTSNNRVAAAEMLGLSRQSLYVKLRKYGLVNKE